MGVFALYELQQYADLCPECSVCMDQNWECTEWKEICTNGRVGITEKGEPTMFCDTWINPCIEIRNKMSGEVFK